MKNRLSVYILIIVLSSIATHFTYFGHPAETVFDEVHFGKFISGYFTHEYFFDIHPPLGKLMISGMGYLAGFKPGFSFETIGQGFSDNTYLWLRLLPTLAGILLPIVVFFLIRYLKVSDLAAFAGAVLIVLENALLVQSRFILLDSFLLLFGFLSLLFYLKHKDLGYRLQVTGYRFLFLSGIFAALAFSVKWTGATFLALIIILEFARIIKHRMARTAKTDVWKSNFQTFFQTSFQTLVLALVIVPAVVYFSVFVLHFSLLNKSGPGDAFMTPEFRKTLVGSSDHANPAVQPLNIVEKFKELNAQMYKSNATLTATHPYSSQWYTWPFMVRPIYYWNEADATTNNQLPTTNEKLQSRIYLLGNPVVWWAATLVIIYTLVLLVQRTWLWLHKKPISHDHTLIFLAGAFVLNLLPFVGIKRAMFLYHYFPALIFSIIASVYLIDRWNRPNPALEKDEGFAQNNKNPFQGRGKRKTAFVVLLAASAAAFIFFAPLTYGLPLTEKAYHLRTWLGSWI